MSDLVIEDGVPIPPWQRDSVEDTRSPLRKAVESLEIGQSIFLEALSDMDSKKVKGKLSNAAAGARLGNQQKKFTVKTAEKNGVQGARIWRLK